MLNLIHFASIVSYLVLPGFLRTMYLHQQISLMILCSTSSKMPLMSNGSEQLISLQKVVLGSPPPYVWSFLMADNFQISVKTLLITRKVRGNTLYRLEFPFLKIGVWSPLLLLLKVVKFHMTSCLKSIHWFSMRVLQNLHLMVTSIAWLIPVECPLNLLNMLQKRFTIQSNSAMNPQSG